MRVYPTLTFFSVVERVKALGWGEELSLLSNERQRVENLAVVIEACENDLTDRGRVYFLVLYYSLT